MNEARITVLRAELRAIHLADVLYWAKGARANRADRAEYRLRQNRLLEIRCGRYVRVIVAETLPEAFGTRSNVAD